MVVICSGRASGGGADKDQLGDPEDRPDLQAAGAGAVRVRDQLRLHAGLRGGVGALERRLRGAGVLDVHLGVQGCACSRRKCAAEKRVVGAGGGRGGAQGGGFDEANVDPAALLGVMGCLHETGGDAARACYVYPLLWCPKVRN